MTSRKNAKGTKEQNFSPHLRQFHVTLGIVLISISLGMAEGYSAILLPQLTEEGWNIDEDLASWIASITALPTSLGCLIGGWMMELIGRKAIHMLCCLPCIAGWILIYFSTNVTLLLVGRFITGICLGLLGPPSGVYAAETSDPNFRGFLLAAISLAMTSGIAVSHILGTYMTWQNVALVGASVPVVCLIVMVPVPESPTFLAKKSRVEDAKQAFYWCRGYSDEAEVELQELLKRQSVLLALPKRRMLEYLSDLGKTEFSKPLAIILVFFITNQWSGNNGVTFYNVMVIQKTVGDSFDEYLTMIIMDVIRVSASVLACYLLQKVGRRPLTLFSCVGCCISLLTISIFAFLSKKYDLTNYFVIPLAALMSYILFLSLGLIPLPWAMIGEVFPLANRGMGSGISATFNYILIFTVVKATPWLFDNFQTEGTFLLFGIVTLVGTAILGKFLPETKGKPLHEIEDNFKKEKIVENITQMSEDKY